MDALPAFMSGHYMCAWCPWWPEKAIGFPELELQTVVRHHVDTIESESSSWVGSALTTEPSLQPFFPFYFLKG